MIPGSMGLLHLVNTKALIAKINLMRSLNSIVAEHKKQSKQCQDWEKL